ncbi:AAA family ATPase [Capnocytophaga cynodegmi]|uniref:ATPase n=1 Tax=Capnocytophaga cynodegmi TaxID=28189 RepID=A0A0B7H021_9FLAO|nr:AAA family ATPase [Capnocytophaga cynodegmi]ATA69050.1 ATPase [Capnocytophaga cynodegmi]CEN32901.1 ATPase, AAA family [Capnocytophaga cynodegmi]
MKIQDSKYYRPINLLQTDGDDNIQVVDKFKMLTYSNPYQCLLDDLMSRIYLSGEDLVIQKEKLKHFVKCTDYYTVDYASKQNELFESEECFFHPELEVFILTDKNLSNEYDNQIFEEGLFKVNYVYYENTNPKTKENLTALFSEYIEKYVSKDSKVSILLKTQVGLEIKTHTIKPYRIDFETMYNDDFLEIHNRVKNVLTNDTKGVVLFHGIAGSGKTNYIKWLTSQIPNKKFIFVPTTMIGSLTDPAFIGLLIGNKNSILVLEDCENYIAERTAFNSNTDVVSSILNIADGMLSDVLECQLICTFNSDISKIDPALLRKGRLIAEYKFKELTIEKANKYLQSTDKQITVNKPYSLAELTNINIKEFKENSEPSKIGFKN